MKDSNKIPLLIHFFLLHKNSMTLLIIRFFQQASQAIWRLWLLPTMSRLLAKNIVMKVSLLAFISIGCAGPRMNKTATDSRSQKTNLATLNCKALDLQLTPQWLSPLSGSIHRPNSLLVIVKRNNEPTDLPPNLKMEFYSSMPSMGHPLHEPGSFRRLAKGVYINESIRFNMPGDWLHELWVVNEQLQIQDQVEWLEIF